MKKKIRFPLTSLSKKLNFFGNNSTISSNKPLLIWTKVYSLRTLFFVNALILILRIISSNMYVSNLNSFSFNLVEIAIAVFIVFSFGVGLIFKYVINGINKQFRIDLLNLDQIDNISFNESSDPFPLLSQLWQSNSNFLEYRKKVFFAITDRKIDFLAFIIAITLGFALLQLEMEFNSINAFSEQKILIFLTAFLILVYYIWIYSGWFSGLIILVRLVNMFGKIQEDKSIISMNLPINIENIYSNESENTELGLDKSDKYKINIYSLEYFRDIARSLIIPNYLTNVVILFIIIITIYSLFGIQLISEIDNVDTMFIDNTKRYNMERFRKMRNRSVY